MHQRVSFLTLAAQVGPITDTDGGSPSTISCSVETSGGADTTVVTDPGAVGQPVRP